MGRVNTNKATTGHWAGQFVDKRKVGWVVWVKAEVGGTLNNLELHVVQPQAQGLRGQNKLAPSLGPLGNHFFHLTIPTWLVCNASDFRA